MTNEEKAKLYNEIYSMTLKESIILCSILFREEKQEEAEYVLEENKKRHQMMKDLKSNNW